MNKPINLVKDMNKLNELISDLEKDLVLSKKLRDNLSKISQGNYITREELGM